MKNEYEYYITVIKPIEKKYTKLCTLYSVFKFKTIYSKMNFYNKILVNYYEKLQNNNSALQELIKHMK